MIFELLSLCVPECVLPTHILALHVSHHPFTQTFQLFSLSLSFSFFLFLSAIISSHTVNHRLPLHPRSGRAFIFPVVPCGTFNCTSFYFILFFSSIIPLTQVTFLIIAFFRICRTNGLGLFFYFLLACWASSHRPPHSIPYTLSFQESSHCAFCRPEVIRFISYSYIPTHSIKQSAPTCSWHIVHT